MARKNKFNIDLLLNKPVTLSEKFHQQTKINNFKGQLDDLSKWPIEWKTVYFKEYPRLDKIILPTPLALKGIDFVSVLKKRRSTRIFSKAKIDLDQISSLLFYSAGIKSSASYQEANRFYPSPGSRYSLEVYLISLNSDLTNGIYHYNLKSHCLEILDQNIRDNYLKYLKGNWVKKAGIIIIFSACFERNTVKYLDRGYRHILNEAGSLTQNFYLVSEALNLAVCGIGGYIDDKLNKLFDLDGVKESVIQVTAIGKKV